MVRSASRMISNARGGMSRFRIDPLLLIFVQWRVERGIIFDGQIVACSLIYRLEDFLQRNNCVVVAEFERLSEKWSRRKSSKGLELVRP